MTKKFYAPPRVCSLYKSKPYRPGNPIDGGRYVAAFILREWGFYLREIGAWCGLCRERVAQMDREAQRAFIGEPVDRARPMSRAIRSVWRDWVRGMK